MKVFTVHAPLSPAPASWRHREVLWLGPAPGLLTVAGARAFLQAILSGQ